MVRDNTSTSSIKEELDADQLREKLINLVHFQIHEFDIAQKVHF